MKWFTALYFLLLHSVSFGQELDKINGVNFVSSDTLINRRHVAPIVEIGANWTAVIPYAFMPDSHKPEIYFNSDWQWIGEREEGVRNMISELHDHGVKVMLKPHVWVGMGEYTGHVEMNHFRDWKRFEEGYANYILYFAQLAEELRVEMICLGTELSQFAIQRSKFWYELIEDVGNVYTGKLTYAENWDKFTEVAFWDSLDYIGVDAYFPLGNSNSSLDDLQIAWKPHVQKLDSLSKVYNKQLLFTEYGYRSITDCAIEPWDYSHKKEVDQNAQYIALSALFLQFWEKENFAGGFLWKWWPEHGSAGGAKDDTFTVQNKVAEQLVRAVYSED